MPRLVTPRATYSQKGYGSRSGSGICIRYAKYLSDVPWVTPATSARKRIRLRQEHQNARQTHFMLLTRPLMVLAVLAALWLTRVGVRRLRRSE